MRTLLLLLIASLAGCGPIRVTVGLVEAERAVHEARDAGAAEHAPYPFTLAEDFLAKAIEEKGYAEWERSYTLAGEATKRAREATALCLEVAPPPLWPAVTAPPTVDGGSVPAADDDDSAAGQDPAADDDDSASDQDPAAGHDPTGDDDDSAAELASPNPWTTSP